MADKVIYIPKDDTQYYSFWRLQKVVKMKCFNTNLNKPISQKSVKSPELLSQQIKKPYHKTLGTSVRNSPMSPPSLDGWLWLGEATAKIFKIKL